MGTTALTPNPVVQPQITQSYRDSACSHPQLGFPEEDARHGRGKVDWVSVGSWESRSVPQQQQKKQQQQVWV